MTRNELIKIAKQRHSGENWMTAFAAELGVSWWTIYRIDKNAKAKVSDRVELKLVKLLRDEGKVQ